MIAIKDVEMPKNCADCNMATCNDSVEYCNYVCSINLKDIDVNESERAEHCPLVEIINCKEGDKQTLKELMDNYIPQVEVDSEGQVDNVNHPKHYEGNIECIDAMQEVLGKHGTISFCIGNAFKYIWRCRKKHETPIEDLEKCRWYINKALELLESEDKND